MRKIAIIGPNFDDLPGVEYPNWKVLCLILCQLNTINVVLEYEVHLDPKNLCHGGRRWNMTKNDFHRKYFSKNGFWQNFSFEDFSCLEWGFLNL